MPLLSKTPEGKYTLKKEGNSNPHPPKFNPTDKMGEYRRRARLNTQE